MYFIVLQVITIKKVNACITMPIIASLRLGIQSALRWVPDISLPRFVKLCGIIAMTHKQAIIITLILSIKVLGWSDPRYHMNTLNITQYIMHAFQM